MLGIPQNNSICQLSTVEPGVGVGVFHEFLLINFVGDELMQGRELWPLNRSVSRHKDAEELWPLNRSIERRIPMEFGPSRCRIGRMGCALGCALTGNSNLVFSRWESGLQIAYFSYVGFSYYQCISATFRKESSNFSPRVTNPPFQYSIFFSDYNSQKT